MALKKVKGNLERIFDKNLTDLVRGIRNNKDNESKYIAQCIEEIKVELRQDNMQVKANAVTKLAYLQMLGYDISWAGFNVIEVMSSSKFTHKRIGYLAASQSFHADLEMLMLTTNMIRKDLSSQNQYEAGVALSALSCFVSPDLARDLSNDIMVLLSSTKPYLRKKGVLMLYKIFLKYPDALRPAFPRLKEKLEDPDPGVQSAAVNVICELARKNPKNYLGLAPVFFKLMTTSTNNWMLIKIIKLFGALTPLEPRLGKKLIEPLTNLIHSTSAMSLLYECVNTVIAGMPNHNASIELCVQKLRILIEDSDQNLKYLGLLAMSKILATHPKSVQAHKDLIMRCLDDKDESIRLRALDLLYGMVGKKNLMEIVKKLMVHMEKAEGTTYRDELLTKIIQICCQNNYQHITNFEWYISVLVELSRVEGLSHGHLVASQMLDVAVRVHAIRPFAVEQMSLLLDNPYIFFGMALGSARPPSMVQVLYAAAWICGEYCQYLSAPWKTLMAMLDPKMVQLPHNIQAVYLQNCLKILAHLLPSQNKAVSAAAATGVQITTNDPAPVSTPVPNENNGSESATVANGSNGELGENASTNVSMEVDNDDKASEETKEPETEQNEVEGTDSAPAAETSTVPPEPSTKEGETVNLSEIQQYLQPFISSEELEVQERAGCLNNFIKCYLRLEQKGQTEDISELSAELASAFSSELNPVALKAQKKVPVPEGLDLDAWINDPPSDSEEETTETTDVFVKGSSSTDYGHTFTEKKKVYEPTEEELTRARETRMQEQELNPHYLKTSSKSSKKVSNGPPSESFGDLPPIEKLELNVALKIPAFASSDKYLMESKQKNLKKKDKSSKKKKKKKSSKNKESEEEDVEPEPEPEPVHVVNTIIEMPEGATISDTEESALPPDDPHRALDIDLDIPLETPEPVKTKKSRKSDPNYLKKKKKDKDKEKESSEKLTDSILLETPSSDAVAAVVEPIPDDENKPADDETAPPKKSKSKSSDSKHKSHKKHKKKDKEKKEKKSKKSEKEANDSNLLIEME